MKNYTEFLGKQFPSNASILLLGNQDEYETRKIHYLGIDHSLMGEFPALMKDDRIILTTDFELLKKVWKILPPKKSKIVSVLALVHKKEPVAYSLEIQAPESLPFQLLTKDELAKILASEGGSQFKWSKGIIGGGMNPENYSRMIEESYKTAINSID